MWQNFFKSAFKVHDKVPSPIFPLMNLTLQLADLLLQLGRISFATEHHANPSPDDARPEGSTTGDQPMTQNMTRTDPSARNLAQAMRRIAIGRLEGAVANYEAVIRKGAVPTCTRPETASVSERCDHGTLTCSATFGHVTREGEQLFITVFDLDGTVINTCDAERVLMGEGLAA